MKQVALIGLPQYLRSDAINAVDDLHQLVIYAHLSRPLILVAHSNGGMYAVRYAETYPNDLPAR